jgi:hypothetical protein
MFSRRSSIRRWWIDKRYTWYGQIATRVLLFGREAVLSA